MRETHTSRSRSSRISICHTWLRAPRCRERAVAVTTPERMGRQMIGIDLLPETHLARGIHAQVRGGAAHGFRKRDRCAAVQHARAAGAFCVSTGMEARRKSGPTSREADAEPLDQRIACALLQLCDASQRCAKCSWLVSLLPMKLYTYFRSSAAYRVRIALNLKGLEYESLPRHLTRDGGEQRERLSRLNPPGLVPFLDRWRSADRAVARDHRVSRGDSSASRRCCRASRTSARWCARLRLRSPAISIRSTTCACSSICAARSAQGHAAVDAWYRHWIATGLAGARSTGRAHRQRRQASRRHAGRRSPTFVLCRSSTTHGASTAMSRPIRGSQERRAS